MGIIYKAVNKETGTVYIGQTRQTLKKRWQGHLSSARNNDYPYKLYEAITKYGENAFEVTQIEEVPDEMLYNREMYWIAYYDSYHNGYNGSYGGPGILRDTKRVDQYDLDGNYIREFGSTQKAAEEYGVSYFVIEGVCIGKRKMAAGYQWRHHGDPAPGEYINNRAKYKVDQYDLEGNFIKTHDSIRDASNSAFVSKKNISLCCKKISRSAGGYQWRFSGDTQPGPVKEKRTQHKSNGVKGHYSPVLQLDADGSPVKKFNSVREAAKEIGVNPSSISRCCAGANKTCGGFIWKYESDERMIAT